MYLIAIPVGTKNIRECLFLFNRKQLHVVEECMKIIWLISGYLCIYIAWHTAAEPWYDWQPLRKTSTLQEITYFMYH